MLLIVHIIHTFFHEQLLDIFLIMKQMIDNRVCIMYVDHNSFHAANHKTCVRVLPTRK